MKFKRFKKIKDLTLINNESFKDDRGAFSRIFCLKEFKKFKFNVAQGNLSFNEKKYTMRGFHYQKGMSSEKKILTPVKGKIFNIVIDLRKKSNSFLKYEKVILSSSNYQSLYVPEGCANAYLTLENDTIVHYYMGNFYNKNSYSGFRYNDKFFKIDWPFKPKVISQKDNEYEDFNPKRI